MVFFFEGCVRRSFSVPGESLFFAGPGLLRKTRGVFQNKQIWVDFGAESEEEGGRAKGGGQEKKKTKKQN